VLAEIAFLVGIGEPAKPYFDEVHYVPAARLLLDPGPGVNLEHPPLAKALIAAGMAVFGDRPLGWRFMSTVFGSLALVGTYLWALALFAEQRIALWVAAVTLFNQVLYVQSRIAMLDVFSLAFIMWALAAFTASRLAWAGVFLGLAIACKWSGVIAWLLVAGLAWRGIRARHWVLHFGIIPLAVYYASFALLSPRDFLSAQAAMWQLQSTLGGPHTYASSWFQWPVIARPIWYFFEGSGWGGGRGSAQAVVFLGNPLVFWAGIAAVLACLHGWLARRHREAFLIFAAYAGCTLAWAVIPRKIAFAYYYFPAAMILGCALAYLFYRTALARWAWPRWTFLALCAALFVWFLPVSSAALGVSESGFGQLMWFRSWR
jgi:dolichyl-phosphate-mannose--protein O-mannosyl transferase